MINCNTCDKLIPDDSNFCPFCGNKVMHIKKPAISNEQLHLYQPNTLLTRAFLFIEDESFNRADDYLEAVLNQEPENAYAYLGKLLVEFRKKHKEDLINCNVAFDISKNYQKIVRFADSTLINELDSYIVAIKKRNAKIRKNSIYMQALNDYNSYDITRIKNAKNAFSNLSGYKDSDELVNLCELKINEIRTNQEKNQEKNIRNITLSIFFFVVFITLIIIFFC